MSDTNFKGMKFRVDGPEDSKVIQKALFKLHYAWRVSGKVPSWTDAPFLYTDSLGSITYGQDSHDFERKPVKESHVKVIETYEIRDATVELDGQIYLKSDLEEALSKLQPVSK